MRMVSPKNKYFERQKKSPQNAARVKKTCQFRESSVRVPWWSTRRQIEFFSNAERSVKSVGFGQNGNQLLHLSHEAKEVQKGHRDIPADEEAFELEGRPPSHPSLHPKHRGQVDDAHNEGELPVIHHHILPPHEIRHFKEEGKMLWRVFVNPVLRPVISGVVVVQEGRQVTNHGAETPTQFKSTWQLKDFDGFDEIFPNCSPGQCSNVFRSWMLTPREVGHSDKAALHKCVCIYRADLWVRFNMPLARTHQDLAFVRLIEGRREISKCCWFTCD